MGAYVSLVLLSLSVFPVPDNKENYRYVKYICVCVCIYIPIFNLLNYILLPAVYYTPRSCLCV